MASTIVERPPVPELREHLVCVWRRTVPTGPGVEPIHVVPDACLDIVWRDDGSLQVAGPDTGPAPVLPPAGVRFAGARFRPGAAPALLGVPADALRDLRVDLADLWGPSAAREMAERVAAAPEPDRALEAALLDRLADAPTPDPLVAAMVAALGRRSARMPELVAATGLSERQLRRRCETAVGYGPKVLDRVLRFRRFLALIERADPDGIGRTLADLALEAGYADQAHLAHECRRLANATPAELQLAWARSVTSASIVA